MAQPMACSIAANEQHARRLRLLAGGHYAWGAVLGVAGIVAIAATSPPQNPFAPLVHLFGIVLAGLGLLTICSGWCVARRRCKLLTLTVASLNCLLFPVGTALGAATIVAIHRACATRR